MPALWPCFSGLCSKPCTANVHDDFGCKMKQLPWRRRKPNLSIAFPRLGGVLLPQGDASRDERAGMGQTLGCKVAALGRVRVLVRVAGLTFRVRCLESHSIQVEASWGRAFRGLSIVGWKRVWEGLTRSTAGSQCGCIAVPVGIGCGLG